jgi:hypothetical protein
MLRPISSQSPLSLAFREKGIVHFSQAIDWVHKLPYGRNSDRADYRLILEERRGTCSTKHAALAALAIENRIHVSLQMAICKLETSLDPKAAHMLEKLGIDYFPEAHCYLQVDDQTIDITFPDQAPTLKVKILQTYTLLPDQIGDHKLQLHQTYVRNWLQTQPIAAKFTFEEIWQIRENWILSL